MTLPQLIAELDSLGRDVASLSDKETNTKAIIEPVRRFIRAYPTLRAYALAGAKLAEELRENGYCDLAESGKPPCNHCSMLGAYRDAVGEKL